MKNDPSSLENLVDLVEPTRVSWWPPAPGWWVLGFLIAVTIGVGIHSAWRRWRQNAYRRAAIRELADAKSEADVATLLKRTALAAYPRDEVASLSGRAWRDWLQETSGLAIPAAVAEALTEGPYRGDHHTANEELLAFARAWVRGHRGAATLPSQPT